MLNDKANSNAEEDDSIQIWDWQYYDGEDKKYETVNIMMVKIRNMRL